MKPKEELFRLIQSLNKAEKGYFKKFTGIYSSKGDARYLKLFDLIEQQGEYDEAAIKEEFGDSAFGKFLSANKAYLFKLILKSLRNFHSDSSIESQVADMVREVEILYHKGMLDEAFRHAEKALDKAMLQEQFYHILNLYFWQSRIIIARGYPGFDMEKLQAFYGRIKKITIENNLTVDYDTLSAKVYYLTKRFGNPGTEKLRQEYQNLLENNLLDPKNLPTGIRSQIKYYNIKSVLLTVLERTDEAFELMKNYAAVYEKYPIFAKENISLYISCLEKLVYLSHRIGQTDEMFRYNEKIREILEGLNLPSTKDYYIFYTVMNASYYLDIRDFDKFPQIKKEAEKLVPFPDGSIDLLKEIILHFHLLIFLLTRGEWKELFRKSWKLISKSPRNELVHEPLQIIRVLFLIACFETGEFELLKSRLRSLRRDFSLKREQKDWEKCIFAFFSKLAANPPEEKKLLWFREHANEMKALVTTPAEIKSLNEFFYFDYLVASTQ